MPKFQEQTSRYSMHINITTELVQKYNAMRLEQARSDGSVQTHAPGREGHRRAPLYFSRVRILDAPMQVSSLEQSMACGEDAVGRTYKNALADLKGRIVLVGKKRSTPKSTH